MKIICVGKIKEDYLKNGIDYYKKNIEIIEVKDEPLSEKYSSKEEEKVKQIEGEKILRYIKDEDYVIALDINGKMLTTDQFKSKIKPNSVYVIGGSLGLSKAVLKRANEKISFSSFTFTHQLFRLILIEQLSNNK